MMDRKAVAGPGGSMVILLVLAAAILSGCGLGPGEDQGTASLVVTRDYGREVLLEKNDLEINESTTAMRLLDQEADLETEYGGGFVQAVDGLSGGSEAGRRTDWFYSVNGIVAERGSAEFPTIDGDLVWWDHRDWTDAMDVGAVVGVYPAPFTTGYDNRAWPVVLDCLAQSRACDLVRVQLEGDGVELATANPEVDAIRVVVGTWSRLQPTPEGKRIAAGPDTSGVFAGFDGTSLTGLDVKGRNARDFGPDAGLVAATRKGNQPPVWVITGGSDRGVEAAAAVLNPEDLRRRYAAVIFDGQVGSLPWGG